jgi:DNA-binding XRE family transcriptional regulator
MVFLGQRRGHLRAPVGLVVDNMPSSGHHDGMGMDSKFSSRIRDCRVGNGLTQQQTAVALGVSIGTVARWEAGRAPDTDCAIKIADYFGVSLDWLLRGGTQRRKSA